MKLSLKWLIKLNEILSANDLLTKQNILLTLDFRLNRVDTIIYHYLVSASNHLEMDLMIHGFLKEYHQIQVEIIQESLKRQGHVPDSHKDALVNRTATSMISTNILASKKNRLNL